jgi:putative transcriptional regulator
MPREIRLKNNIRELRFFAGEMTQKELAHQAGVSRQTIIAIEGGDYSPSLKLAFSIADVFGVPIGEVFSYEVVENKEKKK